MRTDVVIGVLGLGVAVAALAHQIYTSREPDPLVVDKSSRFYCALQADPTRGGDVWTVMYRRSDKNAKPWLRMVRTMGEDWDTQSRCEEIANRLDIYRQDGLLGFEYRNNPNTPSQYVICAKTQVSEDNCPLIVTLLPDDDPYLALREVAGALLPGSLPSYQCNDEQNCPIPKPVEISLGDQLVDEDR
ncbi:MAG: COP23 domain-containing protein [Pseudanabaenales cyanobacterium]|nr:COP23 domain-containing protein [Pseudanabaenales cyanobacterium]